MIDEPTLEEPEITGISSYIEVLPLGWIKTLAEVDTRHIPEPVFVRNWYQLRMFYDHNLPSLYKMRTYTKWYRKDVLVTGVDKNGNRVRVRMDRKGNLI